MAICVRRWFSPSAMVLIVAGQLHAAEVQPAPASEQLDRVFIGVPTQLTLPPDSATRTDSGANHLHCDPVDDIKQSKGQRIAPGREGGDESCASDPHLAGAPMRDETDTQKDLERREH